MSDVIDHAKREAEIMWDVYIREFVNKCPFIQKNTAENIGEQYVGIESAMWGIKSEAAKNYWQRGMYDQKQHLEAIEAGINEGKRKQQQVGLYSKAQVVEMFKTLVVRGCFRGVEGTIGRNYKIATLSLSELLQIDYEQEIDNE